MFSWIRNPWRSHPQSPRRFRPTLEGLEDRLVPALTANVLQTNLVSDLPGVAQLQDPNLVNPWGISQAPGGTFWISDNGSGLSTLYDVPGANNTLTKLCNEWGAKNNVEVKIDYITSQGEKDKLTAAAEAQAGTGHDIMSHRDWNIRIHQNVLEPLDDVVDGLIKQYGAISPVSEYLAKIKGTWRGVPTTVGSQVKPCCSRFDLYKEHAGIDLRSRVRTLLHH